MKPIKLIHYKWDRIKQTFKCINTHEIIKLSCYYCNPNVVASLDKLSDDWCKVTCKRCLRYKK